MSYTLGMNAKLYYKVGGVAASGAWVELTNCTDVTLNMTKAEADVTTRGNAGWRATVGTLKDASIDFEMIWDNTDAGFSAIQTAFLNNTVIGIAALDGAGVLSSSTATGLIMDTNVFDFTRAEPLEDALKATVNIKSAYSATAPEWTTTGLN